MLHRTMIYCAHLVLNDQRRVAEQDESRTRLARRLSGLIESGQINRGAIFRDGFAVARWQADQAKFIATEDEEPWGWEEDAKET